MQNVGRQPYIPGETYSFEVKAEVLQGDNLSVYSCSGPRSAYLSRENRGKRTLFETSPE